MKTRWNFLIVLILICLSISGCAGLADTYATFDGWLVEYKIMRNEIGQEFVIRGYGPLESDLSSFHQKGDRLYLKGYTGYTVVNLSNNKIKQVRVNWGAAYEGVALRPEEIQAISMIRYTHLNSFDEFTDEEKRGFSESPDFAEIKLGSGLSFPFKPISKTVKFTGAGKEIRVIEVMKGSELERNAKYMTHQNGKVYLIGETGFTIIDENEKIQQVILSTITHNGRMKGMTSYRAKDYDGRYQQLKEICDFSKEDQQAFGEMQANPEKYFIDVKKVIMK